MGQGKWGREISWVSIDNNQQTKNDVRQEGLTRTSINPPHHVPSMGMAKLDIKLEGAMSNTGITVEPS
jgi:hypothetical protein